MSMETIEILFGKHYRHVLSFVKIDCGSYLYGADADGNRGEERHECYFDDPRIDNRSLYQFPADVVAEAEKAIDRYL